MKMLLWVLLVLSCAFSAFADGDVFHRMKLDYDLYGASCGPIKAGGKSGSAFVEVTLNSLKTKDKESAKDVKVPVLMFRYTDIKYFANLPAIQTYLTKYGDKESLFGGIVDEENHRFALKIELGSDEFDQKKLVNDYLAIGDKDDNDMDENQRHRQRQRLEVTESGIYCVYIAPPLGGEIQSLEAPVTYKSSYGYLSYSEYVYYDKILYIVVIGLAMFGYLLHYILQIKVGKDFKNLGSISIISKTVIFLVLAPFVVLMSLNHFTLFLANNFIPSSKSAPFYSLFKLATTTLLETFGAFVCFLILMFAMGFGVVYYHKPTAQNFREFPQDLFKKTRVLLAANVILIWFNALLKLFASAKSVPLFDIILLGSIISEVSSKVGGFNNLQVLVGLIVAFFPVVWNIASIIYYFKTKKVISKFPPIASTNEQAYDLNVRLIKSFRQSVLIIFVLPVLISGVYIFFTAYRIGANQDYLGKVPILGDDDVNVLLVQITLAEKLYMNSTTLINIVWLQFVNIYLVIGLIYAIWIRKNNGLVSEDVRDTEEPRPSHFDVESSPEEE